MSLLLVNLRPCCMCAVASQHRLCLPHAMHVKVRILRVFCEFDNLLLRDRFMMPVFHFVFIHDERCIHGVNLSSASIDQIGVIG